MKEDLSCYGGKFPTPHIDRLAQGGTQFHSTQPNSPVCSPARYNLLTGRYASRARGYESLYTEHDPVFIRWNVYLDHEEKTLAHLFRSRGYRTGLCGKWHLGEPKLEEFTADDTKANSESRGKVARNYERCRRFVQQRGGFDYVEALFTNNEMAIPMPEDMTCQHNQHWITDKAIDFVTDESTDPFLLFLTPNLPHHPHALDTLESGTSLTPEGFLDSIPNSQPPYDSILQRLETLGFPKSPEPLGEAWLEKDRAAAVMWLDDAVGAVLDALERSGQLEDTIIAFTSDHLKRGKMTVHRQYVPFLLHWPRRISSGLQRDILISHVDIVQTLIGLAGAREESAAINVGIDGVSFESELKQVTGSWNNTVYTEVCYTRGIVTPEYNYIAARFPETISQGIPDRREISQEGLPSDSIRFQADRDFPGYYDDDQLYETKSDPLEQANIAETDFGADVVVRMKKLLGDQLQKFRYAFGEFARRPREVGSSTRRGEENPIYVCANCRHLEFRKHDASCPVCGSTTPMTRDDAIFYKSEEKWAEGLAYQIPRIRITVSAGKPQHIEISNPRDATQTLASASNLDSIMFYDIYADGVFMERRSILENGTPHATVGVPAGVSRVKVIACNPYYGSFQREVVL